MKKHLFFLIISFFIILFLSIKSIYFSPPYLKISDTEKIDITNTANPTKIRIMIPLFRVENVKSSPIYILNISLNPPPPENIVFKFLNKSFTIEPGKCIEVWGEFRPLNYSWWRITKITIKYSYLGLLRIDEFNADILYICHPIVGELFEIRDGAFQASLIKPSIKIVKINETFNITIYLKVLEDNVKIIDIELLSLQNISLLGYGHPRPNLHKGDILPVILDLIAKNKGEEIIHSLKIIYLLDENIYITYLNLTQPIKIKITD